MTNPTAPPARPHSASPYMALPSTLFRTASGLSGTSGSSRPAAVRSASARGSLSSLSLRRRESEWDDAWDSSSDREEDDDQPFNATSAPIPIRRVTEPKASPPPGASSASGASGSISTSWVSASFHPTPAKGTPPGAGQPTTRAVVPTALDTHSPPRSSASPQPQSAPPAPAPRLPPGGAWDFVETAEALPPAECGGAAGAEALRADAEDILKDPLHLLSGLASGSSPLTSPATSGVTHGHSLASRPGTPSAPGTPGSASGVGRQKSVRTTRRRERFANALGGDSHGSVNVGQLRSLAWAGVPVEVRPIVWQLLLNYLPLPVQPRLATLSRKRKEYAQLVEQYFSRGQESLDQQIWHQIEIDVPRTRPGTLLWACAATQRSLERILYVWAIRHPASGYVQGINDLATPFFEVFLSAYVSVDPELFDITFLPANVLAAVEADTFWCLTKLLDGIQDHYISQQPGIQRLVSRMGDLVKRIDAPLAAHFEEQGVEYMQFAFRWMNCLLMREINVKCTVRMWDTYLSEGTDAFSTFHLYVCSALLVKFSDRLREMDFQEIIMFLQRLPTTTWTDHDIELLLSEAYVLKATWHGADNHFANLPKQNGFGMMGR